MPDAGWKAFERRIARVFGGTRRGPDTRGPDGGKTDVVHAFWGIECKLLGRPSYSDLVAAAKQTEANAEPGQCPVAVVKRKRVEDRDALVVLRLEMFREWFL